MNTALTVYVLSICVVLVYYVIEDVWAISREHDEANDPKSSTVAVFIVLLTPVLNTLAALSCLWIVADKVSVIIRKRRQSRA